MIVYCKNVNEQDWSELSISDKPISIDTEYAQENFTSNGENSTICTLEYTIDKSTYDEIMRMFKKPRLPRKLKKRIKRECFFGFKRVPFDLYRIIYERFYKGKR